MSFKIMLSRLTLFSLLLFTIGGNSFQNIYSQENSNLSNTKTAEKKSSQLENTVSADTEKSAKTVKDDKTDIPPGTDRVIVENKIEIVEDDNCECAYIAVSSNGFPFYALFAIGGGAFVPIALNSFDDEPPSGQTNVVSPSSP